MRTRVFPFVITALFACVAYGEDRTLHFAHTETPQDLQEIATAIGHIGDIQASADTAQRSLALRGTAGQIALAEWLFNELDQPNNRPLIPHEYKLPEGGDDVVRVVYLTSTDTVKEFQEVVTAVRSITDIRRMFTYNATKAVVMRGTADQVPLAEWLFNDLEKPANRQAVAQQSQNPASTAYRLAGSGDAVVRVFYLTHTRTQQDFQEVATLVRSIGDIRSLFTYYAPRAVVARGTTDQLALADWLFKELDKPGQNSSTSAYRLTGGGDDVVRVFYLAHAGTPQRLQEVAVQVRTLAAIRRVFTYNAPRAMALRGTADQIAMADRLIKERDR